MLSMIRQSAIRLVYVIIHNINHVAYDKAVYDKAGLCFIHKKNHVAYDKAVYDKAGFIFSYMKKKQCCV